ncbi:hypothetical protein [Undibacterium sp. SXout20W]|uniref:hypothetical protein n=1 Tax=Undibacterium sp. SXout20W TaxID=3413051 RepID=UPI003BF1E5B4
MFFFRHPKPVVDSRAIAMQVVQQKATTDFNSKVILLTDTDDCAIQAIQAIQTIPEPVPTITADLELAK